MPQTKTVAGFLKKIGKDLAEDPEFAPNIIEPLKMQGVEQFGDYAKHNKKLAEDLEGELGQIEEPDPKSKEAKAMGAQALEEIRRQNRRIAVKVVRTCE